MQAEHVAEPQVPSFFAEAKKGEYFHVKIFTSCIALSVMADDEARVLRPAVRRMGVALVVKCAVFIDV